MLLPTEFRWFREYWRDCLLYDDVPCDLETYEESYTIRINTVFAADETSTSPRHFSVFQKNTGIFYRTPIFLAFSNVYYMS